MLLLSTKVVICSAGGSIVLSASFPEAVWLGPEDSGLMVVTVRLLQKVHTVQQIT